MLMRRSLLTTQEVTATPHRGAGYVHGLIRLGSSIVIVVGLAVILASCTSLASLAGSGSDEGKQLFSDHCAACHGDTGVRIPAAPVGSRQFIEQLGEGGLVKAVAEGKGTMPAWGKPRGGPLSDKEITAVAEYVVKELAAKSTVLPASAAGATPTSSGAPASQNSGASTGGGAKAAGGPPAIPHDIKGSEACLTCHGASAWKPLPASHQGRDDKTCLGCHQASNGTTAAASPASGPSGAVPKIPHVLQGREGICLQCHGPNGIATPVPASHAGRTSDMCTMCHQSTATTSGVSSAPSKPGPPDVPHDTAGKENQCLGCHGPSGLKPAPANHKDLTNEQCLKCHETSKGPGTSAGAATSTVSQMGAALAAPSDHAGRTNDTCMKCHDPQASGTP